MLRRRPDPRFLVHRLGRRTSVPCDEAPCEDRMKRWWERAWQTVGPTEMKGHCGPLGHRRPDGFSWFEAEPRHTPETGMWAQS